MKKIAFYIDGANFFYSQKHLGWHVDIHRLLRHVKTLHDEDHPVDARYYIGDSGEPAQESFLKCAVQAGYHAVTKKIKSIYDQDAQAYVRKANLDVELTVDAMMLNPSECPLFVLLSGDGDFHRLVDTMMIRGVRVVVISTARMLSFELHNSGCEIVDMIDIREDIERMSADQLEVIKSGFCDAAARLESARQKQLSATSDLVFHLKRMESILDLESNRGEIARIINYVVGKGERERPCRQYYEKKYLSGE